MTVHYTEDILKDGFEQAQFDQNDDYEGKVVTTLIRKRHKNDTKKAVLYVHGFNDYFFHTELANEFLKNGFHFYALDLRKYGRSLLGHQKSNNVRDLAEYFADIDKALEIIQYENNSEVVLAGHSTGGLVVTLYASVRPNSDRFKVIYCNSPFFDMNLPNYQRKYLVPFVASLGKKFPDWPVVGGFSEFYGKSLHKEYFGEWNYNLKWKPNKVKAVYAGWISAIVSGHSTIKSGITIDKPILIMHAGKSVYSKKWDSEIQRGDVILNVKHIKDNAQRIKGPRVDVVEIEGGIHDLFLSSVEVRRVVYLELFQWLEVQFD